MSNVVAEKNILIFNWNNSLIFCAHHPSNCVNLIFHQNICSATLMYTRIYSSHRYQTQLCFHDSFAECTDYILCCHDVDVTLNEACELWNKKFSSRNNPLFLVKQKCELPQLFESCCGMHSIVLWSRIKGISSADSRASSIEMR